jgi:hypothetical protein
MSNTFDQHTEFPSQDWQWWGPAVDGLTNKHQQNRADYKHKAWTIQCKEMESELLRKLAWRGKAFWEREREREMHHVSMESSVSWSASIESWISNNCSRILLLQLTTHPQLSPRYSSRSNNMIEEPAASLPLFEILNIRREVTLISTDEHWWSSRQFVCYLMCLFAAASQRGGPNSSHRPWACGIVSPTALQPQLQWWRVFWHWVLHSSVRYKLPAMPQPWRRNCCE